MTKKLVAIDGNSLLYRAFFAVRYLSTSEGIPTNAVYGLTTMLLKVLEEKPDYIVVAFDTPKPTFRHEEYPEYKAQRKAIPEALIHQGEIARELIRAFNIPIIEVPGYEADDIIGALACKAKEQGIETTIVTGDLDALQLVDESVRVMTTQRGVTDVAVYDTNAVVKRFGLTPQQIPDFKGLKGDPSDNIPGVPGIGEKTAAELLKKYGTIENLLDNLSELPDGKIKSALEEHKEQALLSKRLATIVTQCPIEADIEQYRIREPDYDALRDLFVKLEFKTMLKRLPEVEAAEGKKPTEEKAMPGTYWMVKSPDDLQRLRSDIASTGSCSVQLTITDSKPVRALITGMAFCTGENQTAYVELQGTGIQSGTIGLDFEGYRTTISDLKDVLESENIKKYCHDAKTCHAVISKHGINLQAVEFDTMLAAYLIDSSRGSYEIADVAFERLSLELPDFLQNHKNTQSGNKQGATKHSARVSAECEAIYRLQPILHAKLKEDALDWLYYNVELPLARVLAEMELTGVEVDVEQLEALSATLTVDIRETERRIYDMAGEEFNIGSPKQLQHILFEKMGLAAAKKTKTGFSTSAAVLEEMAADYPIVQEILNWRELTKIKSTYADALPKLINPDTGRIHTSLNQTVTATGRLSSSEPNLQNIPIRTELGRQIRKAFVASGDNMLVSADYSQIELRVLAHFTNDDNLIRAFENDEDIHTATACAIFNCSAQDVNPEMRRRAKTINFAVIYGMADFTLGRELGISTHEAREYINTYFSKFPGVKKYTGEIVETARKLGYVTTMFGRRRYLPDIHSTKHAVRMFAERAAINSPIQGTAADLMKIGMLRVHKLLERTSAKIVLQVHDELLFECPPDQVENVAKLAREGMGGAYKMRVPLKVDVKAGKNWADMTEVE